MGEEEKKLFQKKRRKLQTKNLLFLYSFVVERVQREREKENINISCQHTFQFFLFVHKPSMKYQKIWIIRNEIWFKRIILLFHFCGFLKRQWFDAKSDSENGTCKVLTVWEKSNNNGSFGFEAIFELQQLKWNIFSAIWLS